MAETRIHVVRPADRFAMVANAVIRDRAVSFQAVGVYAYLVSLPPDAVTSVARLMRAKGVGRDAIRRSVGELESAGFLRIMTERFRGRFNGAVWVLASEPFQFPEDILPGFFESPLKPATEKPTPVKPTPVKPTPVKPHTYKTPNSDKTHGNNKTNPAPRGRGIVRDTEHGAAFTLTGRHDADGPKDG